MLSHRCRAGDISSVVGPFYKFSASRRYCRLAITCAWIGTGGNPSTWFPPEELSKRQPWKMIKRTKRARRRAATNPNYMVWSKWLQLFARLRIQIEPRPKKAWKTPWAGVKERENLLQTHQKNHICTTKGVGASQMPSESTHKQTSN